MEKRINPLFDDDDNYVRAKIEAAARQNTSVPLAPLSNKPMEESLCGDIPCFYDPETRLVIPAKD